MATSVKGLFKNIWLPQLQFVRWKTKVSITRPRPPHYERALVEKICVPYFLNKRKPQHIPNYESCDALAVKKVVTEEHPLKTILAKESLDAFNSAKMIAFFHINQFNDEEKFQHQLVIKKNGMNLLFLNKSILEKAFAGTKYESLVTLYKAPTATVISPEADIYKLLGILKKLPKLALMGAVIHNKLLSLSELKYYGKFKNIEEARLFFVQLLNVSSQNFVQQVNYQASNLVALLNQHKKILNEN